MTLNLIEIISLWMLGAALLLGLVRLVMGPAVADRLVASDILSVITISLLAGLAVVLDSPLYLDVALIYGVIAFVAVVAVARAIEGNRS